MLAQRAARELIILLFILTSAGCAPAQKFGDLSRMAKGKTDKMDTHGFTEIYEHIFFPLRNSPIKVCEIGIWKGGSLQVWRDYFPKATVYGIDIVDSSWLDSNRIKTFVADQSKRNELKSFIDKYGGDFDILLDDGGHTMEQQQVSFGFLFKYVKAGGYYVIEDAHTSLIDRYKDFGAEADEHNTTLTMLSYFIRHAGFKSVYWTTEEGEYLSSNVEYCNLFVRNNWAHSITCIFKKREGKTIQ